MYHMLEYAAEFTIGASTFCLYHGAYPGLLGQGCSQLPLLGQILSQLVHAPSLQVGRHPWNVHSLQLLPCRGHDHVQPLCHDLLYRCNAKENYSSAPISGYLHTRRAGIRAMWTPHFFTITVGSITFVSNLKANLQSRLFSSWVSLSKFWEPCIQKGENFKRLETLWGSPESGAKRFFWPWCPVCSMEVDP